jgi:large subunit ribosomal protein L17
MHHNKAFRKLGRKHQHRVATLRALSTALFEHERITTTLMKAKELRPFAEKLITRSKRDDLHARRLVVRHIQDRTVAKKLFETLSPRYTERHGGYMRILKLGRRQGDGAEMALVELLGSEPVFKKKEEVTGRKKPGIASRILGGRGGAAKQKAQAPAEDAAAEEAMSEQTEPAPKKKAGPASKPKAKPGKGAKKKK